MLKKGDRVEWKDKNGKQWYGIVRKGGKTISVVVDGGKMQTSGPSWCFRRSKQPRPKINEPNVMSDYSVASIKKFQEDDESDWTSIVVQFKGKDLLEIRWGRGEKDKVTLLGKATCKDQKKMYALAKQWMLDAKGSCPKGMHPLRIWSFWYLKWRTLGMGPKTALEGYDIKDLDIDKENLFRK